LIRTASSGKDLTSFETLACFAALYSTTGGQRPTTGSELTVAQALNKLVTITRTARRGLEHTTLDSICFLHVFKAFRQPSRALARAMQGQEEQRNCEGDGDPFPDSQRETAAGKPLDQRAHHLLPLRQSS